MVKGIGVGETVAVGDGNGARVGVADGDWQAVMKMRHPIRRSFFIVLIKTQLSGALFQTIVFRRHNRLDNKSQRMPLKQ